MGMGQDEVWEEEFLSYDTTFDYWVGKDGEQYVVNKMKPSHIKNCIRMIVTRRFNDDWLDEYGDDWKEVFEKELASR